MKSKDYQLNQEIINSIMQEYIERYNVDAEFYSFCRINYFNSSFFKKCKEKSLSMKLEKIAMPFRFSGLCKHSKGHTDIIVFLNDGFILGKPIPLVRLLHTTYHEIHHMLYRRDAANYDGFACLCDSLITKTSWLDRFKYFFTHKGHEEKMYEILADIHAVEDTKRYYKDNNIELNAHDLNWLDSYENYNKKRYDDYDLSSRIDKIINNFSYYTKNGAFPGYIVFRLFLNEDGSVKSINEIFSKDSDVLRLHSRLLVSFIKTQNISRAIKESNLDEHAMEVINELLTKGSLRDYFEKLWEEEHKNINLAS